jgi:N utilization substance protein A
MNQDLLRIIDGICREKNIDREGFLTDLENAMASAIRKAYETEDADVSIDPMTADISAVVEGAPIDMQTLGRIAAQTAKQVIIQRTRERERTSVFEEFSERQGSIVTGSVVRIEGGNLLVNIGRTEGFLPRSEQIPGETHQVGDRLRVLILEVREQPNQVKIILSRSHPDFIVRLFELEVPEVAERIIEIRALAREAGYRTKVAVSSIDSKVDAVGACVGVRGSRIKNIVDELGGEKIDIVRWNESSQILIQNALKPAEVQEIALCLELAKATVVVAEDQLSLAIGKRGQNVRLAARLTNWDVDILTPAEHNKNLEIMEQTLKKIEGIDDVMLDKLVALGCVSVADIDDVGAEPLTENLELDPQLAERIVYEAGEEVIRLEEEKEAAEKAKAEAEAAAASASAAETAPETESAFIPQDEGAAVGAPPVTATVEPAAGEAPESPGAEESAVSEAPAAQAPETDEPAASAGDVATAAEAGAETEATSAGPEAEEKRDDASTAPVLPESAEPSASEDAEPAVSSNTTPQDHVESGNV